MTLQRLPDWQTRLVTHLSEVKALRFDPATHHCALFVADCVRAMTGQDPAAGFRGLTLQQGLLALRKAGFADHVALTAALLEEVPVAFGRAGDVAAIPTPEGPALGLVQGAAIYVLRPTGLGLVSLLSATRMFRMP